MTIADVVAGKQDWRIECGDALEVLRTLPDECVQTCITSPPYWGLRDYGADGQIGLEQTPEEYVGRLVTVFREVRRVLRRNGTIWVNMGDSYAAHGSGADGKELAWLGSGSLERKARKPPSGLKPKDLIGIPWMVVFALRADGWYLRSDIVWAKSNPMPESVRDRPTRSHEYIFLLSKSRQYYYDADAIREYAVGQTKHDLTGPGYVAPGQTTQRGNRIKAPSGWDTGKGAHGRFHRDSRSPSSKYSFARRVVESPPPGKCAQHRVDREPTEYRLSRNKRDVWTVATHSFPGAHFATFPPALIEPCILAGAPEDGVVLDPFAGAGTTGLVALRHGRRFVGIELNPEYVEMSSHRIIEDAPLLNMGGVHHDHRRHREVLGALLSHQRLDKRRHYVDRQTMKTFPV